MSEDGCWRWTAACDKRNGYGKLADGYGGWQRAHRVSYEIHKGPIPKGLEIDHLCRNRSCVNPDHLEAVTRRENLRRGMGNPARNARKTHCSRGHEFTVENTLVMRRGGRTCRICKRARQVAYLASRTEAQLAAERAYQREWQRRRRRA